MTKTHVQLWRVRESEVKPLSHEKRCHEQTEVWKCSDSLKEFDEASRFRTHHRTQHQCEQYVSRNCQHSDAAIRLFSAKSLGVVASAACSQRVGMPDAVKLLDFFSFVHQHAFQDWMRSVMGKNWSFYSNGREQSRPLFHGHRRGDVFSRNECAWDGSSCGN